MKICLVQAPRWSVVTPSFAVALLTGNLRSRGFEVTQHGFDPTLYHALSDEEKRQWYDNSATSWNDPAAIHRLIEQYPAFVDQMVEALAKDAPDIVGFSVKCWSQTFSLVLAERIKQRCPKVYVIFGGPEMTNARPEDYFRDNPQVDAICRQEADISFPRFLEAMRDNGGVPQPEPGFAFRGPDGAIIDCGLVKEIPSPAQVPFADYSDYDLNQYTNPRAITMAISRGCINRCSFCSEAPAFLRYRAYSAERVFAEIEHHWNATGRHKPMKIYFNDSLLDGDVEELEKLADLLLAARDRMPVEYGGMMFIRDHLSNELIGKLAMSGMTEVFFGLESGSEEVLRRMRKRLSLATAERVFEAAHNAGIAVTVSIIFGHPGETETEFYRSLSFLRRNAKNVNTFLINDLQLFGDCDITRKPEKYGVDRQTMSPIEWVGDDGRNTLDVRKQRQNIACTLLWPKVADIGGYRLDAKEFHDPMAGLKSEIAQLKSQVWDLYRQRIEKLDRKRILGPPRGGTVGWLDALNEADGGWRVSGWAKDPRSQVPPRDVILINQNQKVVSIGHVHQSRKDVEAALQSKDMLHSGWEVRIDRLQLDSGDNVIHAIVYVPEEEKAYRLNGEATVTVR